MRRRRHYTPWYLTKPFFFICAGIILGAIIYLSHEIPPQERTLQKVPISQSDDR
ncbi:MAG: hypothetical protein ACTSXQ_04600 [Alphaproteobacteria bacterium]